MCLKQPYFSTLYTHRLLQKLAKFMARSGNTAFWYYFRPAQFWFPLGLSDLTALPDGFTIEGSSCILALLCICMDKRSSGLENKLI